jgi:hypothetical protein
MESDVSFPLITERNRSSSAFIRHCRVAGFVLSKY